MRSFEQISCDLQLSTEQLVAQIQVFSPENFNIQPNPSTWSGAQVCEHLYILEYGVCKILAGETKENNRDPEQKIALMEQAMSNFEQKIIAPNFTQPAGKARSTAEMIEKHQKVRQNLLELSQIYDLGAACISAKHPFFGVLTRIEWIYMIILHCQRHLQQMKNIFEAVK